jgi:hypothetical protein
MLRKIKQRKNPLHLRVNSDAFFDEWERCAKDRSRDASFLFLMAEPLLNHWTHMFTQPGYPKDSFYMMLAHYLKSKGDPAALIAAWVDYEEERNLSVKSFMNFALAKTLRKLSTFKIGTRAKLAHQINMYIVQALFIEIRSFGLKRVDEPSIESTFSTLAYVEECPDWLQLKNAGLTDWEYYTIMLYGTAGLGLTDISNLTHILIPTLQTQENKLWHSLKAKH